MICSKALLIFHFKRIAFFITNTLISIDCCIQGEEKNYLINKQDEEVHKHHKVTSQNLQSKLCVFFYSKQTTRKETISKNDAIKTYKIEMESLQLFIFRGSLKEYLKFIKRLFYTKKKKLF